MDQTNCPISENLPLGRLVADALGEIERLGYSRRSRNRYRAIWEHLIEFSDRERSWEMSFPGIWRRALWRSIAWGMRRWISRARDGGGISCWG